MLANAVGSWLTNRGSGRLFRRGVLKAGSGVVCGSCPESLRGRVRIHVGLEAIRDSHGSDFHRVPGKVGVPRGRLYLRVTEELTDHRQALPEGERPRGEAVSQVMQADVFEPGLLADDLPRCVQRAQAGAGHAAGKHPIATLACGAVCRSRGQSANSVASRQCLDHS